MNMNNLQRLGMVLDSRIKKSAKASVPTTVELGTINENLSLTVDSLGTEIPQGQYMVNLTLNSSSYDTQESDRLPDDFRKIKGGDRVSVMWIGHEPVVTAIIISS